MHTVPKRPDVVAESAVLPVGGVSLVGGAAPDGTVDGALDGAARISTSTTRGVISLVLGTYICKTRFASTTGWQIGLTVTVA